MTHNICRRPVPLLQGVGVDAERDRRIGVSQPSGDGTDVDAGADELGGGEVAEVMEAHVLRSRGSPELG